MGVGERKTRRKREREGGWQWRKKGGREIDRQGTMERERGVRDRGAGEIDR